jgi:hypothetical protein
MLLILPEEKLVGHPGNVIADYQVAGKLLRGMLLRFRHRAALLKIVGKQFGQAGDRTPRVLGDERVVINVREKKAFQLSVLRASCLTESRQPLRDAPDIVVGSRAGLLDKRFRIGDQVADQVIDHVTQGFIKFQASTCSGMRRFDPGVDVREKRDFVPQRVQIEQIGFERVVEVGGVVGDFVDPVNELGFKRRPQVQQILGQFRMRGGRVIPGMLDDAFADFKRQVEAVEFNVTMFEMLHDAKRMQVVIEAAAVDAHQLIEFSFAGMAKGRVANIVHQGQSLNELCVDPQSGGHRAGDLGDFKRVCKSIAKVIGEAGAEDLRFCFQTPERARVDDAVAVARIFAAVGVREFR